jgi:hypothetical protein
MIGQEEESLACLLLGLTESSDGLREWIVSGEVRKSEDGSDSRPAWLEQHEAQRACVCEGERQYE